MSTANVGKTPGMPSPEEVDALLKERKGTVHVWQTLREKYGDPKGHWGAFIYRLITQNATKHPKQDAVPNSPINNVNQNAANDNVQKVEISSRNVLSLGDQSYPLSCAQYLRIISDIAYLENDLRMLTSLVTAMLARSRSMRYRD